MITRLLVANRGEIACRVFDTCRRLGVEALAVYSDADADARHVRLADRATRIGDHRSYLDRAALVDAALRMGAQAIHPGYGFLSENAEFARAVEDAGLIWVGPSPQTITLMADKLAARATMRTHGLSVVPGATKPVTDLAEAEALAAQLGYPLLIKPSSGGGGIGMEVVDSPHQLGPALERARSKGQRFFAVPTVYVERLVPVARHVEVQILGRADGRIIVVGDRDCSVQRRNQKVIEEAPAPGLSEAERAGIHDLARRAGEVTSYRGAGTVELLFDRDRREAYFLEMNTRLQVEHPVTEMVAGVDLVEAQLRIAAGEDPGIVEDPPTPRGHAVELRVYAEDPVTFLPGPGRISRWREPTGDGIRIDRGYDEGDTVTRHFDPLMAKLCVLAADRTSAIAGLAAAAADFEIAGPRNNLAVVPRLMDDGRFVDDRHDTTTLASIAGAGPRDAVDRKDLQ